MDQNYYPAVMNKKMPKPPGPVLQYVNKILHIEPFSFLAHGIFWSVVLVVGCPLAGVFLMVTAFRDGFSHLLSKATKTIQTSKVDAIHSDRELGVYITGCDSGFGKDLAFDLAKRGYTVFAACLTEEGIKKFHKVEEYKTTIIPLQVDVTKDEDVARATDVVRRWLTTDTTHNKVNGNNTRIRVLHAIVNNAGVGNVGLIDWVDVNAFRRVMDVNFFGTVRTVKSFLPIVKEQAYSNVHPDNCRIINVISAAGLVASLGAGAYSGSKHAVEAFTSCLRMELKLFNVPVVSVNPGWHNTPLANSTAQLVTNVWSRLDPEMKEEYGEGMCYVCSLRTTYLTNYISKRLHSHSFLFVFLFQNICFALPTVL